MEVKAEGQKVATTIEVTTTGDAVPFVTITNPANLTLPTGVPDGSAYRHGAGVLGFIAGGIALLSQLL